MSLWALFILPLSFKAWGFLQLKKPAPWLLLQRPPLIRKCFKAQSHDRNGEEINPVKESQEHPGFRASSTVTPLQLLKVNKWEVLDTD